MKTAGRVRVALLTRFVAVVTGLAAVLSLIHI